MSDVTYNESYHAALLATIAALSSEQTKIIFASKYRHASETSFTTQLKSTYKVMAEAVFDGDNFCLKDEAVELGDIEILVLTVSAG